MHLRLYHFFNKQILQESPTRQINWLGMSQNPGHVKNNSMLFSYVQVKVFLFCCNDVSRTYLTLIRAKKSHNGSRRKLSLLLPFCGLKDRYIEICKY